MRFRTALPAFVSLLALGVAAACTGHDPSPNLSPVSTPPTISSSPVASPTATAAAYPADVPLTGHNVRPGEKPPVYPAAARATDQAGANAFAEFFMKTLDWAYATTNPSYMKHYYGPTCGQCQGLALDIGDTAKQRHFYEGGRITIRSIGATPVAPVTAPATFCTLVVVDVQATSVVTVSGAVINGSGAARGLRFKLCTLKRSGDAMVTYLAKA